MTCGCAAAAPAAGACGQRRRRRPKPRHCERRAAGAGLRPQRLRSSPRSPRAKVSGQPAGGGASRRLKATLTSPARRGPLPGWSQAARAAPARLRSQNGAQLEGTRGASCTALPKKLGGASARKSPAFQTGRAVAGDLGRQFELHTARAGAGARAPAARCARPARTSRFRPAAQTRCGRQFHGWLRPAASDRWPWRGR